MKKNRSRSQRAHRSPHGGRLIAESLELRRLCSTTLLPSSDPMVTLFASATGSSNLVVGHDGTPWYTAQNTLNHLTAGGTAVSTVPPSADGSMRRIVSNVAFAPDNSAWFAVSTVTPSGLADTIVRLDNAGQFQDMTSPISATLANFTVDQAAIWYIQGSDALGHISSDGNVAPLISIPGARDLSGLTAGADGSLWFTGQATNAGASEEIQGIVGLLTPAGGVTTFDLPTVPTGITTGSDGNMYLAENGAIVRLSPTGSMTTFTLHGAAPQDLSPDASGAIWFVDANNSQRPISRLAHDGTLTQYPAGLQSQSVPTSLLVAPDGKVWFTASSATTGFLGQLNAAAGSLSGAAFINCDVVLNSGNAGIGTLCFTSGTGITLSGTSAGNSSVNISVISSATLAPSSSSVDQSDSNLGTGNSTPPPPAETTMTDIAAFPQNRAAPPRNHNNLVSFPAAKANPNDSSPHVAIGDPGVFEGEFSVQASSLPPTHRDASPSGSLMGEYTSRADKTSTSPAGASDVIDDSLAGLQSSSGFPSAFAATPTGAVPWNPPASSAGSILAAAYGRADRRGAAVLTRAPAPPSDPATNSVAASAANWWKFTIFLSTATGLDAWQHTPVKRTYW